MASTSIRTSSKILFRASFPYDRIMDTHGRGYALLLQMNPLQYRHVLSPYRDARVFTIYEGTSEIQRIVISNQVLKDKRQL
ncbi:MAG: acyl-CoA dehydrogenase family protein [Pseudomonadota bacterium]